MAGTDHTNNKQGDSAVTSDVTRHSGSDLGKLGSQYLDELFSRNKDASGDRTAIRQTGKPADGLQPLTLDFSPTNKSNKAVQPGDARPTDAKPEKAEAAPTVDRAGFNIGAGQLAPLFSLPDTQGLPGSDIQGPPPIDAPPPLGDSTIQIGNRQFQVSYGPDVRTNKLSLSSPDGTSQLELVRDGGGALMVSKATGEFQPNGSGALNFEGIPLRVSPDGHIVGDISFNSKGDVIYKTGTGPDRVEYTRRADGTQIAIDFNTWKRTVVTPDGKAQENYWDGYEWRNGTVSADGSRVDFQPPDPDKPAFMQRTMANGQNTTLVSFADGVTFQCDWNKHIQVQTIPGQPPQQITRYFNGSYYSEVQNTVNDQPRPGDTTVVFKDSQTGAPQQAIMHADGSMTTMQPDNTIVEKDPSGYVTSVSGPKGSWQFQHDVNGDIQAVSHSYIGPDGMPANEVLMRQGFEANPGTEFSFSRNGLVGPRLDMSEPLSDPNHPQGYNTFVDAAGHVQHININVAADGTVRIQHEAVGDSPQYLSYEMPGQDMYRIDGAQRIYDRPAGVTEVVNMSTKESMVKFTRNGKDFILRSADGPLQVQPDGTVIQDNQQQQVRNCYMPNGLVATYGNDGSNPPKMVLKQVELPAANSGEFVSLKDGVDGISALAVNNDYQVTANTVGTDGQPLQTVFDPKDGIRSDKRASDNVWRISGRDGNPIGIGFNAGQSLGQTVSDVQVSDGIQSGVFANAVDNTHTIARTWTTSKGQQMNLNVKLDQNNQVVQFSLPAVKRVFNVAGNPDVQAAQFDPTSGMLSVTLPNGMVGQFNPNGTFMWQSADRKMVKRYNKDGVVIPNDTPVS